MNVNDEIKMKKSEIVYDNWDTNKTTPFLKSSDENGNIDMQEVETLDLVESDEVMKTASENVEIEKSDDVEMKKNNIEIANYLSNATTFASDKPLQSIYDEALYANGVTYDYVNEAKSNGTLELPSVGLDRKNYEDISCIGNVKGIKQYTYKNDIGINIDDDGMGYINIDGIKYYTVAMGSFYGKPGDKFLLEIQDGDKTKYVPILMVDGKSDAETAASGYKYHGSGKSANVVEIVGSQSKIQDKTSTGDCSYASDNLSGTIVGIYSIGTNNPDTMTYNESKGYWEES